MSEPFTAAELDEIAEIVRLGDPFNRERTECEARQLVLMRRVPETAYCLVPVAAVLPQVWIGNNRVSCLWDNS